MISGGDSEGETPVPIPNTAVKSFSADGTARETVWESRTPPGTEFPFEKRRKTVTPDPSPYEN